MMNCSMAFLILEKVLLNSIPSPLERRKSSSTCFSISMRVALNTSGFLLLSIQEIVTMPGVVTLQVKLSEASRDLSSFSVFSMSVVTQNLVILLTSLWSGVWELCVTVP